MAIGVKDLIDTQSIETRYGSAAYIGNLPSANAAIVSRLVEQGAIIIGKTTTHEFAWGVTTSSREFGDTLNPLDTRCIPGGSSGGAAAAIAKPFWFQLYVMRDRDFVSRLIQRAKAAKCSALVLTLDLQILGQRHKDVVNGLSTPPRMTIPNIINLATKPRWCLNMLRTNRRTFRNIAGHAKGVTDLRSLSSWTAEQFDPALSWDDVKWIKDQWGGKLILKGILDPEDAEKAAASGADALIVSNHGGRQLDGAVSSISALPAIVDAVGDRIEVLMDGGIRSGQDVLKALALGAKGVFIGRSFLYGLGAGGEAGVTACLDIIRKELDITMAFCGLRDINDVDSRIIARR